MRWLKRLLPLFVIIAACAIILYLPDLGPERYTDLAALFKHERTRQSTVGYSVAVCRNGSIIYQESFGTDGAGEKLSKGTPMYLGPSSEVLTGALLYSFSLQGKINLDEDIRSYLPEYPGKPDARQQKNLKIDGQPGPAAPSSALAAPATITVRDMADPTMLPNEDLAREFSTKISGYEAYEVDPSNILNPGRHQGNATHNRFAYRVLGVVMESVGVDSFDGLLQSRILRPLGMRNTTAVPESVEGLAVGSGRFFSFQFPNNSRIPNAAAPADGIATTSDDMAKFLAYITAPPSKGIASLPSSSVTGLYQPLKKGGSRGFGWKINEANGNRTVYQGGSVEGFSSRIVIWPERNAGIVVLAPQGGIVESSIILPMLTQAAEKILFTGSSSKLFPVSRVLLLIGIALGVYILTLFSQTSTAHSWAKAAVERQETGTNIYFHQLITARTTFGLILRVLLIFLAPTLIGAIFGGSLTYHDLMVLEPGTSAFLAIALLAGALRNTTRLVWLRRTKQE
ncbi:MAG: beta-lactamase family protein [Spirochaetaceae bacterium]|nr:beta-lactamase family protein [Spirochaetaceae bacterium]